NPVGWMETFDILAPAPTPVVIVVNDGTADGRDVSWLWDVPFERLGRRSVVAAGTRAVDLGLRLRYAGVPHAVVPDPVDAISVRDGPADIDVVAYYTAFRQLRRVLRAP